MKKVWCCIIAVTGALLLSACGNNSEGKVPVQLVSSIMGHNNATAAEKFAGVVTTQSEIKIEKNENAEVAEIKVSVGDTVKTGDVLFVYNTEQISLNLEKAQLELEQLNASISNYNATIAQLERDKANAPADMQLSYELEIKQTQADLVEANYSASTKKKEIESLQKSLENASVKAETSGRIQSINTSGGTDSNGNPLPFMTIVQTASYQLKGYVNEANLGFISEGMSVVIRSRVSSETWKGTVSRIEYDNPQSSSNNYYEMKDETTSSSRYPFYVTPESSEGLMLGQHVYIEPDYGQIEVPDENAVTVPEYYIANDGEDYVWADNGKGKLEKRKITVKDYDENMGTYIIESGLSKDDYIALPSDSLKEGLKCTRYDEDIPADVLYPDDGDWGNISDDGAAAMPDDMADPDMNYYGEPEEDLDNTGNGQAEDGIIPKDGADK